MTEAAALVAQLKALQTDMVAGRYLNDWQRRVERILALAERLAQPERQEGFMNNQNTEAPIYIELRAYLDAIVITSENIGDIRRSLFLPWDSSWNGLVRDWTARRENALTRRDRIDSPLGNPPQPAEQLMTERKDGTMESAPAIEMPLYKCHKEVYALKIKAVVQSLSTVAMEGGSWDLVFEEDGYAPHVVAHAWYVKHMPVAGGYYVVYNDGYSSFSPAQAFEEGYTRL